MRRSFRVVSLALAVAAIVSFTVACGGGGGGGGGGGRPGKDTPPNILNLQTPKGLQGKRGADPVNGLVQVIYQLRDKQFDPVDILEVEFGVDPDLTDGVIEYVYAAASQGPGGDGTTNLDASPGGGALHFYVWDTLADVGTKRYVRLDYVYTADGRVQVDGFGDPVFEALAGVRLRLRPIVDGVPGDWVYTDPFDVNNNNVPVVTVQGVVTPSPEGVVNEYVSLNWTGIDLDSDNVTISVDWSQIPAGYDPSGKTTDELAAELTWHACTGAPLGEGTYDLTASQIGIPHVYGWDSVPDTGTVSDQVMLRVRPLDEKREVGLWVYLTPSFLLDNFTVFNHPNTALPGARVQHTATTLSDGTVLIVGGSATEGGAPVTNAYLFFPGSTQTTYGNVAGTTGSLNAARRDHTATRFLDGKVFVAGGYDAAGNPLNSAEIYDPATKTFTAVANTMPEGRASHAAVLLRSGQVLLAGGKGTGGTVLASAVVFDPVTGIFTATDNGMYDARTNAPGVLLSGDTTGAAADGWVLLAGGEGTGGAKLASIEIYDPEANEFLATDPSSDLSQGRMGLSLTGTLSATYGAVAAGGMASPPANSLELFDAVLKTWSASGATMRSGRAYHSAVMLGDGKTLLIGGQTNEAGTTFTNTVDIYDLVNDQMILPNGDYFETVRGSGGIHDAECVVLQRGRAVIFGGVDTAGPTSRILVFVPRSADGFNDPPQAQIKTPATAEPYLFGARIYWRAFDSEVDPVRILAQFQVADDLGDDSGNLPGELRNRWLPATMKERTVLGEYSSGVNGLGSREDWVSQSDDPIDYPDQYPNDPTYVPNEGEHLFVWDVESDLGLKGDYNNVFFRVIVYGAVEGETATTGKFSIAKNAPVIARIEDPLADGGKVFGNVVFPFYLQDSDSTDGDPEVDLAKVLWEYAIDVNGDGYITDADKLAAGDVDPWYVASHASVSRTIGAGVYTDAGVNDLVSAATGNDHGGIPWGAKLYFVWDSVADIGSPVNPRADVFMRATAWDYPLYTTPAENYSLGIGGQSKGFTLEKDPGGLYLTSWRPIVNATPGSGYLYANVGTNERIVFTFSANVDPATVNSNTIKVLKEGTTSQISGYYQVVGNVVTFWPQVDELPQRTDIMSPNSGYTVRVPGYDYANAAVNQTIVKRLGADTGDTNAWNLLNTTSVTKGFRTGATALSEAVAPTAGTPTYFPTGPTRFTWRFSERLVWSSVTGNVRVWAETAAFPGVQSIIPGTITLSNVVDGTGEYGLIVFTPLAALPPSTTVRLTGTTGLRDLYGNAFGGGNATTSVPAGGTTSSPTFSETFSSTTNRDSSLTTAFWGTAAPPLNPEGFSGVAGKLTGLYEFGTGADGAFTTSTTNYVYTYVTPLSAYYYVLTFPRSGESGKKNWQWTTFDTPTTISGYPAMLKLTGSDPITFRCTGAANVNCAIFASADNGGSGSYTTGSVGMPAGGAGYAGGGSGGGGGSWSYGSTTPTDGATGKDEAGSSAGTHGGKGGGGKFYSSWDNSSYTHAHGAAGGGGGSHASAGTKGGSGYDGYPYGSSYAWSLTAGAAGTTYGSMTLANGLEGGAGGGQGGNVISPSYYGGSSGVYFFYGGSGGGGGGAFSLVSLGKLTLASSGSIQAKGGNGGNGYYTYPNSSVWYLHSGAGGGGAGGCVKLVSADLSIIGTIDVRGGTGGPMTYASGSYSAFNNGGNGGDGRVVISTSKSLWMANYGAISTGAATVSCSTSGTSDWSIAQSITLNTDTGTYTVDPSTSPSYSATGYSSSAKVFYVRDFKISAGYTLTVKGSKPFIVYASRDVDIAGTIRARGGSGQTMTSTAYNSYDYNGTSYWICRSTWTYTSGGYPWMDPTPGAGGPGGGQGGTNAAESSGYSALYYSYGTCYTRMGGASALPASGNPGYGYDGTSSGLGGGKGGYPASTYVPTSTTGYLVYVLPGAGAGGNSCTQGKDGYNNTMAYGGSTYGGTSGKASTSTISISTLDFAYPYGGAGGGASGFGGDSYYSSSGVISYNIIWGTYGKGGGGGGGFVGICAANTLKLSGGIDVAGGTGASTIWPGSDSYPASSAYSYYSSNPNPNSGASGGGGGGNIRLHAANGVTFSGIITMNAGGGAGGMTAGRATSTGQYLYSTGGAGGGGGIKVTGPTAPVLPEVPLDPTKFLIGNGTLSGASMALSDTGVTTWQDTTAINPAYNSVTWSPHPSPDHKIYIQGAHTQQYVNAIDVNNVTSWIDVAVSGITGVRGCRFFRVKVVLQPPNGTSGIDDVWVNYTYTK